MGRNTKKSGMKSDMRYEIEFMHHFTDRNGTYHGDGYKPKSKKSLIRLLRVLRRERGEEGDFNDIDVSEITDMSGLFDNDDFFYFNGDISSMELPLSTEISLDGMSVESNVWATKYVFDSRSYNKITD